eukprot:1509607-Amphidinium_carterae.1
MEIEKDAKTNDWIVHQQPYVINHTATWGVTIQTFVSIAAFTMESSRVIPCPLIQRGTEAFREGICLLF